MKRGFPERREEFSPKTYVKRLRGKFRGGEELRRRGPP
jgi:hypothetical protein